MRFAGYAAVFDVADRGGDVVRAGAFRASLAQTGEPRGAKVPLLWQHRGDVMVGRIEYLAEDARGLRVIGRLAETEAGAEAARALRAGRIDGLSFGYRVREARAGEVGTRELVALDLVEVSLVSVPMQRLARVHRVGP
jgi:uncharacterized protein